MNIPVELGDAFRYWCIPVGENSTTTHLQIEYLAVALNGYDIYTKYLFIANEIFSFAKRTCRHNFRISFSFLL